MLPTYTIDQFRLAVEEDIKNLGQELEDEMRKRRTFLKEKDYVEA